MSGAAELLISLQIIATGALERFPHLKIVLVENEMS